MNGTLHITWRQLSILFILGLVMATMAATTRPLEWFSTSAAGREPSRQPALSRLPLSFIPNAGQFDASVKYHVRGDGASIFFKQNEIILSMQSPKAAGPQSKQKSARAVAANSITNLRLRYEGANRAPAISSVSSLPGKVGYFIGNNPSRWRANLPTYSGINYKQIYPGIDLKFEGTQGNLKSTYSIAPRVSPSSIRWRYDGAKSVRVNSATGNLHVALPTEIAGTDTTSQAGAVKAAPRQSEIIELAPVAWQVIDGKRRMVDVRFLVLEDNFVRFVLSDYDRSKQLVIDPTLTFSNYFGGGGRDFGQSIAVDSQKNFYLTGVTASANFPPGTPPAIPFQAALSGKTDVFISKLNPAGNTVLYSTYLGGADDEWGFGIALDASNNAYITGYTRSSDFPTATPFQGTFNGGPVDAFVAKLSADGQSLVYSTYLGGNDEEVGYGIAVGSGGIAHVTGYTRSSNFSVAAALQAVNGGIEDAFVVKFKADGTGLLYGTYLGGAASDYGQAIAVDSSGKAFVTGYTRSSNFPTASPLQAANAGFEDVFLSKLKADGSGFDYSTYLGGSDSDYARGITIDSSGNAYLTGSTRSTNFPTAAPLQAANGGLEDAFVTKVKSDGSGLRYSTYLGGSGADLGLGIAVDQGRYPSITGRTQSENFPTAAAFQTSLGTPGQNFTVEDIFAARLLANGSGLLFSTYHGGNDRETGASIASDADGGNYITGYTFSMDFPTENLEPPTRGLLDEDAIIVKITEPIPVNQLPIASLTASPTSGSTPLTVNFDGSGSSDPDSGDPVVSYSFDFGDGSPVVTQSSPSISHTYTSAGTFGAALTVTDFRGGVSAPSQVMITVNDSAVRTNYALTLNGGTAIATSHPSGRFPALAAINGDRTGAAWGSSTGGWNDNSRNAYPDILEVDFMVGATLSPKLIDEINVFTLQNNWTTAGEPTLTSPATGEGILDFIVQYWCENNPVVCPATPTWTTIPVPAPGSGNVTGNDKAWRQFTFPAVTTTKIRVVVNNSRNNWSRIVELEALGGAGQP